MVVGLDYSFRDFDAGAAGAVHEVRILAESIIGNGGVVVEGMPSDGTALGYEAGDEIRIGADDFRRLADAFFSAVVPSAAHTEGGSSEATGQATLEALLMAEGLAPSMRPRVHALSQVGLRLVPNDSTIERSRLGGPALLTVGEIWPRTSRERPLSFIAGIDLSELPVTGVLPTAGWMLFYADINYDDGGGVLDRADNCRGSQIRVYVLDEQEEPTRAEAPADLIETVPARAIRASRAITIPDDMVVQRRSGLDDADHERYENVASTLRASSAGDHWMLGAWCHVQGYDDDEESTLLLQIADDPSIGFGFLDAGAIQFRIPADALAARDWPAIEAIVESC